MMIILLQLVIITSIWCLGVTIVTQPEMALGKWRTWGDLQVEKGNRLLEPLFICEWCMPSIHTLIGYLFGCILGVTEDTRWYELIAIYPLVAMASSFVVGMSWSLFKLISTSIAEKQASIEYFEESKQKVVTIKEEGKPEKALTLKQEKN